MEKFNDYSEENFSLIKDLIEDAGYKMTYQRREILMEFMKNEEEHLSAEEIYNIFEVLNARGKKLKQMELLKNHVMKYIQPRTTDVVDKAKEKWNKIFAAIGIVLAVLEIVQGFFL